MLWVPWVLVGQWFCYGMLDFLKDMHVDSILALLVTARVAEVDRDARPDLDWFLYTSDERINSILSVSARWGKSALVASG